MFIKVNLSRYVLRLFYFFGYLLKKSYINLIMWFVIKWFMIMCDGLKYIIMWWLYS